MASPKERESQKLLCEVVRCRELSEATRNAAHPCSEIVRFQDRIDADFQPPTPWVGRLSEAPILFIGSNPNISGREHYPIDTSGTSSDAGFGSELPDSGSIQSRQ